MKKENTWKIKVYRKVVKFFIKPKLISAVGLNQIGMRIDPELMVSLLYLDLIDLNCPGLEDR